MLAETADEFPLPEESELSGVSASLEVLVSPDESSDGVDPPPPPLPPPPQEITRRLIINSIRKDIFFPIFPLFLERNKLLPISELVTILMNVFSELILVKNYLFSI